MVVADGLVNGAVGVVTGFIPPPPSDIDPAVLFSPRFILVKFYDPRVGKNRRETYKSILTDIDSTPIPQVETPVRIGNSSKVTGKRTQNTH